MREDSRKIPEKVLSSHLCLSLRSVQASKEDPGKKDMVCMCVICTQQACLDMAAVTICSDLEPPKIKSVTVSIVSPSICL